MQTEALVADASTPGLLVLRRRRHGAEYFLGQMRLDEPATPTIRAVLSGRSHGEQILLRLPESAVLERSLILPLAAERDPERLLGYEMERLTPFTAADVFWGFVIEKRDRARSRLMLRLTVIPRAAVATLIGLLTTLGGPPSLLEVATAGGIPCIRLGAEGAHSARGMRSARSLRLTAALLAVLALLSPYLRQSLELADLHDRLDSMAVQVKQAEALGHEISDARAGKDAVEAETRRLGHTMEALAAITEMLPDNSYLTEFTIRERKMTISGLSESAPKLISRLSTDRRIHNPAFMAPVTKNENNHLDIFSIRAELAH